MPHPSTAARRLFDRMIMLASAVLGGGSIVLFAGVAPSLWPIVPMSRAWPVATALVWDVALCLVFFVQHSTMNRRWFHRLIGPYIHPRYHGALYGVASGLALTALAILWQPTRVDLVVMPGALGWLARVAGLAAVAGFVWGFASVSEDMFGWRPISAHLNGVVEESAPTLVVRGPYRWVRHPLYSCVIVLMWTDPRLSLDGLVRSALFTAWIVLGTVLEEADLVRDFGDAYRAYRAKVPMLVPWRGRVV